MESCRLIQDELLPFHFGTCSETARTSVEEHLAACADCLRGYLALKRAVETASDEGPRPSEAARARLRRAVAAQVPAQVTARRRAWLWGGAVAAAIAALLLLLGRGAAPPHAPRGEAPAVDSANTEAENLNFL